MKACPVLKQQSNNLSPSFLAGNVEWGKAILHEGKQKHVIGTIRNGTRMCTGNMWQRYPQTCVHLNCTYLNGGMDITISLMCVNY